MAQLREAERGSVKLKDGSQIRFNRSGGVLYLTAEGSRRTYVVHSSGERTHSVLMHWNVPRLSAAEAADRARAYVKAKGIDVSKHLIYMVDALNLGGTPFWRITWIQKSPDAEAGRIYVDVRDDGPATHIVRKTQPPLSRLATPQLSIREAIARAEAHARERNIDVSKTKNFVQRIAVRHERGVPCWAITWQTRKAVKGGQTYIAVHDDGTIKVTWGE